MSQRIPDSDFVVKEFSLMVEIGKPRPAISKLRKSLCVEDVEWRIGIDGRPGIWLTEGGANKVRSAFGLGGKPRQPAANPALPAKSVMAESLPVSITDRIEDVEVLPTRWLNDRLVRGRLASGEEVRVRIRAGAKKNVIPPMKIPCRLVETGLWECVRHPRYRGKM